MGESSAETYTQLFCDTMFASRSEYIKFPPLNELRNVVNSFSEKTKIQNVVGAIDGNHIPIKAPTVNKECYFNQKHRYSILLQGVVGTNLKFYDAFAGVPESVHDARLLRISKFGKKMKSFRMFQEPKFTLEEGVELKPIILGDSAYAVKSWLFPPYTRLSRMPPTKKEFNNEHARGREPVERAFGHLKGRWRVLMNESSEETKHVKITVLTCVVLHNICITSEDDTEIEHDIDFEDITNEPSGELLRDIIVDFVCNL